MDRQPTLDGERWLIRPLEASDWDALFDVAADPLIWKVHPAHDRWQEPVFRVFFEDALEKGGALAIVDKATGAIVGSSRFQDHDPANGGSVDIGWTFLSRSVWGKGVNAAIKRMMLVHAFRHVERVIFRVGESNIISRKAMEKIGGIQTDQVDVSMMAGVPQRHVVYEITREHFSAGPLA